MLADGNNRGQEAQGYGSCVALKNQPPGFLYYFHSGKKQNHMCIHEHNTKSVENIVSSANLKIERADTVS